MKCKGCNNEVSNGTRICPFCGNKLGGGKKVLIIFSIVILFLVAIGVGAFGIYSELVSPKNVFDRAVDTLFLANNSSENDYNTLSTDINLAVEKNGKINEEYEFFSDLSLNMNFNTDSNNETEFSKIQFYKDKEELLKLDSLINTKYAYLYNSDYYEYPVKFDIQSFTEGESDESFKITDKNTFKSILKEEIKSQIKEEDLSSEKTVIEIDSAQKDVTKYVMKLNTNEFMIKLEKIIENLVSNDEFINCFNEKDKAKDFLNSLLDNISNGNYDLDDINLSIYYSGLKTNFEKWELEYKNSDKYKIALEKNGNNDFKFSLFVNDEEEINADININGDSYDIEVNAEDIQNLTLKINVSNTYDSNINYTFSEKNAVDFSEISSNELNEIINKIKLNEYIEAYFGNLFASYTLSVDKDYLDENNNQNDQLSNDNISLNYNLPTGYTMSEENFDDEVSKIYSNGYGNKIKVTLENISVDDFEEKIGMLYEELQSVNNYSDIEFDISIEKEGDIEYKKYILNYTLNENDEIIEFKTEYIVIKIDDENIFLIESEEMDEIFESDLIEIVTDLKIN